MSIKCMSDELSDQCKFYIHLINLFKSNKTKGQFKLNMKIPHYCLTIPEKSTHNITSKVVLTDPHRIQKKHKGSFHPVKTS